MHSYKAKTMREEEINFDILVRAVIQQESNGKHDAVSPAGAKGAMQLMDATGKEWHKLLNIKEPYDPFNWHQNTTIGKAYLKWLINKFETEPDQIELALAAYNGGIGNVKKAMERAGSSRWEKVALELKGRDGQQLIETQRYIPSVLVKYQMIEAAES